MFLPKPEKIEKKPKPIPGARLDKEPSKIDYSNMAFAKPAVIKKVPKPIASKRKADKSPTINSEFCFFCGSPANLENHHVFFGNGHRELSEFYGLKLKVCRDDHRGDNGVHFNRAKDLELKKFAQIWFKKHYPNLDFLTIFGINYLEEGDGDEI